MRADNPARITIRPTVMGTSPRAISVKGGPYADQGKLRQRQPGGDHGVGVEQEQKAKCGRGYDYVVGQRGTCNESPVAGHVE